MRKELDWALKAALLAYVVAISAEPGLYPAAADHAAVYAGFAVLGVALSAYEPVIGVLVLLAAAVSMLSSGRRADASERFDVRSRIPPYLPGGDGGGIGPAVAAEAIAGDYPETENDEEDYVDDGAEGFQVEAPAGFAMRAEEHEVPLSYLASPVLTPHEQSFVTQANLTAVQDNVVNAHSYATVYTPIGGYSAQGFGGEGTVSGFDGN